MTHIHKTRRAHNTDKKNECGALQTFTTICILKHAISRQNRNVHCTAYIVNDQEAIFKWKMVRSTKTRVQYIFKCRCITTTLFFLFVSSQWENKKKEEEKNKNDRRVIGIQRDIFKSLDIDNNKIIKWAVSGAFVHAYIYMYWAHLSHLYSFSPSHALKF